jgi:hypothetical protein
MQQIANLYNRRFKSYTALFVLPSYLRTMEVQHALEMSGAPLAPNLQTTVTLHKLEQELIHLKFFTAPEPAVERRLEEIIEEMQPLYRQLGGSFITSINANYVPGWKPKD